MAPDWSAAHESLGLHLTRRGRFAEAVECLRQAVSCDGRSLSASNNLGAVAAQAGEFETAIEAFRAAVALRPDGLEARLNLGLACLQAGRLEDAVAAYRTAEETAPGHAETAFRLSVALGRLGRLGEAEAEARRAVERAPDSAEELRQHGDLLRRLGRPVDAVPPLLRAVALQPGDPVLRMDAAVALHEAGRTHEALREFGTAAAALPDSADHQTNLGVALAEAGYLEESAECHRRAVELKPDLAEAHNNLAITLVRLRRHEEAVRHYDRAATLRPDYADARANRARALLATAPCAEAWREYEWRLRGDKPRLPARTCPRWDGTPLPAGTRLLLVAEQGLGDVIQFVRFAPEVRSRSGVPVVVECVPELHPLLTGVNGVDAVVAPADGDHGCAAHLPLMSVPAVLNLDEAGLRGLHLPYLLPTPDRVDAWRQRIAAGSLESRWRVGITWQGNPKFKADRARSIPLVQFGPLASVPGVQLVSLQKGAGAEQVAEVPGLNVLALEPDLDAGGAFLDTLALLASLDVVVTADTAVAHVAGAAGVAVWVVLPFAADWRWGVGRADSPWYPTARLFRQPRPGDWEPVFDEIAGALAARFGVTRVPATDAVGGVVSTLRQQAHAARGRGDHAVCVLALREVQKLRPHDLEGLHELALALARNKDRYEAELCFRRGLAIKPDAAEVCNNYGILLEECGRADEACEMFRRSLAANPRSPETHSNLGVAHAARGDYEAAVSSYAEALRQKPDHPAAWSNLGNSLRNLGLPWQAVEALDRAIAASPDYAEAHNNRGIALVLLGRIDEALACYRRALDLRPDYAEAHLNRALSLLASGQTGEGWREYEWRLRAGGHGSRTLPGRAWDGGPVRGGPLLLTAEQGLGDTVQFARLVPLAARQAGVPVVLECQPALIPLIRSFPEVGRVIPAGGPLPPAAAHAPLLSLPGLLRLTPAGPEGVPVPYIHPDPERVAYWRSRLNELLPGAAFRVGIGWQGNPRFKADQFRSIPLAHFGPLASVPGVGVVSLQRGAGEEQLGRLPDWFPVARLGADADREGAFVDTLAAVASLDLVVTSDTALAHVAGAAGAAVWVVLPFAADWRWGRGRADCPWYPSVRLFRQPRPGDWNAPFRHMADELARRLGRPRVPTPDGVAEAISEFARRGSAEVRAGRLPEAVEQYKRGLRVDPTHPDLLHNMGVAWAKQGKLAVAQCYFREAVRVKPAAVDTHNNLGLAYLQQDRLDEAEAAFRAALRESPDHPDALNHLGVVFANREQWADAVVWYEAAVKVNAGSAEVRNNLGNALRRLDRLDEAERHLRRATELRPDAADMWNNLGIVLGQQGHSGDALACFERAATVDPNHADAWNNRGVSLADLGREAEGLDHLERAVRLKPDFPEAHKNLGLTRLIRGDLRGGWGEYEWRWRCKPVAPRPLPGPRWDGGGVRGGPL